MAQKGQKNVTVWLLHYTRSLRQLSSLYYYILGYTRKTNHAFLLYASNTIIMILTDRLRDALPRRRFPSTHMPRILSHSLSVQPSRISPPGSPRSTLSGHSGRTLAQPPPSKRYKVLSRTLRTGGNGSIDLALDKTTGRRVVLKRQPLHAAVLEEAAIHAQVDRLNHPNVVGYVDSYVEGNNSVVIVSDYCEGGDLISQVEAGKGIAEADAFGYALQLLSALAHLHEKGFCHADVKIDNCCLTADGQLKLVDFGSAVRVGDMSSTHLVSSSGDATFFRPGSGTLTYTAPEVFANRCADLRAADVWASGVMLFTMLTGCLPWEAATSRDHRYLRHWRGEECARWRDLSVPARTLLHGMLAIAPKDRFTAAEAHTMLQNMVV